MLAFLSTRHSLFTDEPRCGCLLNEQWAGLGEGVVQSRAEQTIPTWLSSVGLLRKAFSFLCKRCCCLFGEGELGLELGVSCGLHVWLELPEICKLITPIRPGDCSPQSTSSTNPSPTSLWGGVGFKGQERMQVCIHRRTVSKNLRFSCSDIWTQHPTFCPNKGT